MTASNYRHIYIKGHNDENLRNINLRNTKIQFCISTSSRIGQSGKLLDEETKSGNWLERYRFTFNPSDTDIKNWTDTMSNFKG